jgi:xylan 1,4-beta-xylosidase
MGSPQGPTTEQYSRLEKAGMLKMYDIPVLQKVKKGVIQIKTSIQRQGVGFAKIEWE